MFAGFTALQNAIIEGLRRGEAVDEIARRLDTTPGYIYNTRSEAKKMGFTIAPPQDTNLQHVNGQPEQPQPPLNKDSGPESRTGIPQQPATTQTVTQDHYRENQEGFRYLNHIAELSRQYQQVPQTQQTQSAPRDFWKELDMMQTRFVNGFMQLFLPNALMFAWSCQWRKQLERMFGLS